ncbi:13121_t:CDS:10, partial [Dentiscutata heterogama]
DQSLVANNVQENTSNKVNELTAGDKCDEMEDIQVSQQYNIINEKERMEYTSSESDLDESQASGQNSNKVVNLSQTLNDPEFGEEIEYENDANTNQDPDVGGVNVSSIPSYLTDNDSLPSISEILKPPTIQGHNPSKEKDLPHPDKHTYETENNIRQYQPFEFFVDKSKEPTSNDSINILESQKYNDPQLFRILMKKSRNKKIQTKSANIKSAESIKYQRNPKQKILRCLLETQDLGSTSVNSTTSKFNELQIGSTAYCKRLKSPSYYAEILNKLRKGEGMSDNFASNTNDLVEMYSQPIEKYFNEDSIQVLLEPLPKQMKDVDKQQKEMSQIALEKTTDYWKGHDLKARINKKFGNINSRSVLKKWTACWKLHHFLWVTNITPREMIEAKLNANYFLIASASEYNFLIKELVRNPEFPKFHNIKGENILELVNIAKNAYAI